MEGGREFKKSEEIRRRRRKGLFRIRKYVLKSPFSSKPTGIGIALDKNEDTCAFFSQTLTCTHASLFLPNLLRHTAFVKRPES